MNGDIVDSAQVRLAALFLVNIGVPIIVGMLRHQPGVALIGAVAGMLLAFAELRLPRRCRHSKCIKFGI